MNCKTKFTLILLLGLLTTVPLRAFSDGDGYKEYCTQLKEKLSVDLTVPYTLFESLPDTITFATLNFGDYHPESGGCPIFYMGPTVKLDEYCSIVLMDMKDFRKPRPGSYPDNRDYTWPASTAFMLNNCDSPWARWYIYNIRGVRSENYIEPSPQELRDRQAMTDSLRNKYERRIDDGVLLEHTDCDRVFIVKIPYLDKIGKNGLLMENFPIEFLDNLMSGATECYAVEFYKHSAYVPLQMLFFIDGKETNIDECIARMAEYICFE